MSVDPRYRLSKAFFLSLLAMTAAAVAIAAPLAYGIAWGVMIAFLWMPVHERICAVSFMARRPNLCATASLILFVVCLSFPMSLIIQSLTIEIADAYTMITKYIQSIRSGGLPSLESALAYLPDQVADHLRPLIADQEKLTSFITSAAQTVGSFLSGLSTSLLLWTGSFISHAGFALVTFFFMCRDGAHTVQYITELIPLEKEQRDRFVARTGSVFHAVVYGTIMTVAVQATLGAIGWAFAGLGNAMLAGCAMFIFGMIPMGTAVVWLPGSIYLAAVGMPWNALGLFLWGALVVSMIDSFLRPLFMGSGSALPTFALMIGLLGGIATLGLLGVFLGPLIMAVFLSVLDLYRGSMTDQDI